MPETENGRFVPGTRLLCPGHSPAQNVYHLTENDYIINSETIMDVKNYILFSTINSQAIDVM